MWNLFNDQALDNDILSISSFLNVKSSVLSDFQFVKSIDFDLAFMTLKEGGGGIDKTVSRILKRYKILDWVILLLQTCTRLIPGEISLIVEFNFL